MKRVALILVLCLLLSPLRVQAVELELSGKSACLMDVSTGTVLYENKSHEK